MQQLKKGDIVFVFNPKTKRCKKRIVERQIDVFGGKITHVSLVGNMYERNTYPITQLGKTKKEAENIYYKMALEKRDHWQSIVDWYEKRRHNNDN